MEDPLIACAPTLPRSTGRVADGQGVKAREHRNAATLYGRNCKMRRLQIEGKHMFNRRLTNQPAFGPVPRALAENPKKRAAKERLSGVNREASNRVAPTTR